MGPLCHAGLFFPSSLLLYESVATSSTGDQLLILFPVLRARPSPIPPTQVDPISLRFQAPSRFFVGYNNGYYSTLLWKLYKNVRIITSTFPCFIIILLKRLVNWGKFGKRWSDKPLLMAKHYCSEATKRWTLAWLLVPRFGYEEGTLLWVDVTWK